ncbi:hypothetical protein K438DRAFT_1968855 [Mycena galopus ATCC 62051]|nr:hypothetical protein K438DRAFT_1968855 [Mycena galopus ATCC 62051]
MPEGRYKKRVGMPLTNLSQFFPGATTPILRSVPAQTLASDEMELEDPSQVPIVMCADGAVLLRANAAPLLLKMLKKREETDRQRKSKGKGKVKAKARAKAKAKANVEDSSTEDGDDSPSSGDEEDRTVKKAGNTSGAASSSIAPSHATQPPSRPPSRKQLKCCYRNGGEMSDSFNVTGLAKYTGSPTKAELNTLIWSDAKGEFTPLPSGIEPVIPEDLEVLCEVYRAQLGLD